MQRKLIATTIAAILFSFGAHAQNAATETARDTDQQKRIEQGLQSGQLSTKEAASLESKEKRIDATEARDMKDGKLSAGEKAQIQREQNHVSADIYKDKHNAVTGNPNSVSSQRMQADVQRNVDQQKRVEAGVQNGSLTNREVAKLERGQAHVDRKEAIAGRDGHVNALEQGSVQRSENKQSRRVYRQKHDAQTRG